MRDSIRREVTSIVPMDALETEHVRRTLEWIDSGAELCRLEKPATPPVHLVSYFAVIDRGHILLVDHINAQLWLPPGGHVEPGEHPRRTVKRELFEELGIVLEEEVSPPVLLTCTETVGLTAGHTDVSLWYVIQGHRDLPVSFDPDEFHSVRWFTYDDIPFGRSDPHMKRFVSRLGTRQHGVLTTTGR